MTFRNSYKHVLYLLTNFRLNIRLLYYCGMDLFLKVRTLSTNLKVMFPVEECMNAISSWLLYSGDAENINTRTFVFLVQVQQILMSPTAEDGRTQRLESKSLGFNVRHFIAPH